MISVPATKPMTRGSAGRHFLRSRTAAGMNRIPSDLRSLLPLARVWAVAAGADPLEALESAPLSAKRKMVEAVFPHFEALETWIVTEGRPTPTSREESELELLFATATEVLLEVYTDQ